MGIAGLETAEGNRIGAVTQQTGIQWKFEVRVASCISSRPKEFVITAATQGPAYILVRVRAKLTS